MITGKTKVLAILGNPVTHSLSPQMHAGWIEDHGIDATYVALPLAHDGVAETMRALRHVGLHGANVTVPFKEAAARAADVCSGDVEALGVANTLYWKDGKLHVHNTDATVLSGRGDRLDVMFAIGAMPASIPTDIRKASLRGQIGTKLTSAQLQEAAKHAGVTVEELQKDEEFQPYFNFKLVLVEEEDGLRVGYFEFLPPSMLD